ncbi:hypothetical protein IF2G_10696 [Cordyceps javanica]|nr:hypothetical protein IF2G_10696 [Cordyceps javanica]
MVPTLKVEALQEVVLQEEALQVEALQVEALQEEQPDQILTGRCPATDLPLHGSKSPFRQYDAIGRMKVPHHHTMKASTTILLVAQTLLTVASAANVARVPGEMHAPLIRGDPPPYHPAHDKRGDPPPYHPAHDKRGDK